MIEKIKYALPLLLLSSLSFAQSAREIKLGTSLAVATEIDLSRFLSASMDEEIRLLSNNIGFDRSVTSAGLDYLLFNKKIKIGAYYAFIYLYNNNYRYEPRHRYYLNLSYKETNFKPFTLSWRGRLQGTYRDENTGEYRINPKYVMKNKLEVVYALWGLPWRPYLSCDLSTALNNPVKGYELLRIRYEGGANWRLDRTTYMEFFLRFDEYLSDNDPHKLSVGLTYKRKF